MKLPRYLNQSIGLTQAAIVLLASVFIGLIFSTLYLSYNLSDQRRDAMELTEEILTAAEGGATNAAWTLNANLATQVTNSMVALGNVQTAELLDDNGSILAKANAPEKQNNPLITWFSSTFIGEQIRGERELTVIVGGKAQKVGSLSINLDASQITNDFFILATTVFVAALIQAFSIALVLLWLSYRLVTSPLRRAANAIANIDPKNPEAMTLPIPAKHEQNELGHLLKHANKMLSRLYITQEQLRNLATRDPLTNQPNRTLITDRLSRALKTAQRNNTLVAVLFMDLDRFKNINDSLGHDIGDVLLIETASRLTKILRSNDSVGRLGGDEFLIILEDVHDIDEIVRTVQRISEALSDPYFLQGHEVLTSGSIGIAVYPDDGEDTSTLMRCADLAMYEAKGSTTRWHFFAEEMSDRVDARLKTEAALGHALERHEFLLHFQPKIATKDNSLAGCEALLRWRSDPQSLAAGDFIGIAEDSGIIVEIGAWVLEQACKQIRDWSARYGDIPISINVSGRQLKETDFIYRTLSTIRRYGINPNLIELEITETILIEALDESFNILKQLREAGITISIDDFGTGYSSLSYLTRLPVDTLKIDRSFVSGPQRSKAVLEMIVSMAKTLQLKTVAEGVETQGQRNWLTYEGCDYLQGYLFSTPVSAAEFEDLFLQQTSYLQSKAK